MRRRRADQVGCQTAAPGRPEPAQSRAGRIPVAAVAGFDRLLSPGDDSSMAGKVGDEPGMCHRWGLAGGVRHHARQLTGIDGVGAVDQLGGNEDRPQLASLRRQLTEGREDRSMPRAGRSPRRPPPT